MAEMTVFGLSLLEAMIFVAVVIAACWAGFKLGRLLVDLLGEVLGLVPWLLAAVVLVFLLLR
jgi:hypothetical protein